MFVMVPMMRCPPENALLRRGHCQKGHAKLQHSTCFKCTMGEIAVIACGDTEHLK
jgi:hypothetical protein